MNKPVKPVKPGKPTSPGFASLPGLGLALALAIGFVPAAGYAFGVNGAEVRRIRARQVELSAHPGTKAVVDEFDRLETAVDQVRHRGLIHTGILWVMVSAIAGAGLSRLSGRDPDAASRD